MAQIGTIRVDTQNNGTVSVPVFDTGDSGSSIYEFVRVQTGSGTGFIPVEDTSNATYPYLRVKSQSHGTVAMTDRSSAIPDAQNLQANHDARQITGLSDGEIVSTWTDETGNGRDQTQADSTTPTYQTNEINGNPAVLSDSDYFEDGNYLGNKLSYYLVYKQSGGGSKCAIATYKNFSNAVEGLNITFVNGEVRLQYGDGSTTNTPIESFASLQDGTPHVIGVGLDADNGTAFWNFDGTERTQSVGTLTIDHGDVYLMTQETEKSRSFDGHQGHNLIYGTYHDSSTRSSVVSYLASEWGISI